MGDTRSSVRQGVKHLKNKKDPRRVCSRVKTSQGVFLLVSGSQGLYAVRFPAIRKGQASGDCLSPLLRKLRYAKLDLSGYTDFQRRVYRALVRVPAGKVVSYGELARRAGFPKAARAVGTAMKKNRLPIAIPCHRVIKADGSLGQYGPGVDWKRKLLEQERCGR